MITATEKKQNKTSKELNDFCWTQINVPFRFLNSGLICFHFVIHLTRLVWVNRIYGCTICCQGRWPSNFQCLQSCEKKNCVCMIWNEYDNNLNGNNRMRCTLPHVRICVKCCYACVHWQLTFTYAINMHELWYVNELLWCVNCVKAYILFGAERAVRTGIAWMLLLLTRAIC